MQSDGVVMGDHAYTIREQWHRVFFLRTILVVVKKRHDCDRGKGGHIIMIQLEISSRKGQIKMYLNTIIKALHMKQHNDCVIHHIIAVSFDGVFYL